MWSGGLMRFWAFRGWKTGKLCLMSKFWLSFSDLHLCMPVKVTAHTSAPSRKWVTVNHSKSSKYFNKRKDMITTSGLMLKAIRGHNHSGCRLKWPLGATMYSRSMFNRQVHLISVRKQSVSLMLTRRGWFHLSCFYWNGYELESVRNTKSKQ